MNAKKYLWALWVVTFFFAAYQALTSYLNSSMLTDVFAISGATVGLLYSVGSACALITVLILPRVFRHNISIKKVLSFFAICVTLSLTGIVTLPPTPAVGIILFAVFLMTGAAIGYLTDLVLAHYSNAHDTGRMRGTYLTVLNIAWVIAPFASGYLFDYAGGYTTVYALAGLLAALGAMLVVLLYENIIPHEKHHGSNMTGEIKAFFTDKNLRMIFTTNALLQVFYAIMVIYVPIYLVNTIGLPWEKTGIIFTIMLTAFVLLEYPLGYIADNYLGEKEILTTGLIIMTGTTLGVAFLGNVHWAWWALLLFGTRVGACSTEIMNESFFFKHVSDDDVSYISFYRGAARIAYIVAPLIVSLLIGIFGLTHQHIFILLAVVIISGVGISMRLGDTK